MLWHKLCKSWSRQGGDRTNLSHFRDTSQSWVRLTSEPDERVVPVCVVRNALHRSNQGVHFSQAGGICLAVTCVTSDGMGRGQRNVHVSQCYVEEVGLSSLPARDAVNVTACSDKYPPGISCKQAGRHVFLLNGLLSLSLLLLFLFSADHWLLCSCVAPCILNNPRCCRFVFLCKRPKVKRLLHNACVFNQREAELGVATSSLIRQSTAWEQNTQTCTTLWVNFPGGQACKIN